MNKIEINRSWCKKCRVCITFCPKDVYDKKASEPIITDINKCIGCMLCEMRCPDFAITVVKGE